jgi:hypothetical protein
MRLIFAAVIAAAAIASAQAADTPQQASMKSCAATWKTMPAADKGKTKYTDYMGTCMKKAPATAAAAAPAPAASMAMTAKPKATAAGSMSMQAAAPAGGGSAKCKDGTTVTYKSRQGTCSGHKGVATWL